MIPIHGKLGQGMRVLNWYGKNEVIPVFIEKQHFQFLPESRSEIGRV